MKGGTYSAWTCPAETKPRNDYERALRIGLASFLPEIVPRETREQPEKPNREKSSLTIDNRSSQQRSRLHRNAADRDQIVH